MRIRRVLRVMRREKILMVLAPALFMLAMGPLALLRPAVPAAPVQVTRTVTVSQPIVPTATLQPRGTLLHATRAPRRGGGGPGRR